MNEQIKVKLVDFSFLNRFLAGKTKPNEKENTPLSLAKLDELIGACNDQEYYLVQTGNPLKPWALAQRLKL